MTLPMTSMLTCYCEIRQRLSLRHIRHAGKTLYAECGNCGTTVSCAVCPIFVLVTSYNPTHPVCTAKTIVMDQCGLYNVSDFRYIVMKLLEPFAKVLS